MLSIDDSVVFMSLLVIPLPGQFTLHSVSNDERLFPV